jgi:hypothetical protein
MVSQALLHQSNTQDTVSQALGFHNARKRYYSNHRWWTHSIQLAVLGFERLVVENLQELGGSSESQTRPPKESGKSKCGNQNKQSASTQEPHRT